MKFFIPLISFIFLQASFAIASEEPLSDWADLFPHIQGQNFPTKITVSPKGAKAGDLVELNYENPDWLGEEVSLHFGFDGWNLDFPGAVGIEHGGNAAFGRTVPMQASLGKFTHSLRLPANAKAWHFVFCKADCGPGTWDNRQGNDYAWPLEFPYIGPILTWPKANGPAGGILIAFEHPDPRTAWIEYRQVGASSWQKQESASGTWHRFLLANLQEAREYEYRVGVGSDYISALYKFKTLPHQSANLSFLLLGDMQDNGEDGSYSTLVSEILSKEAAYDFIVSPGDLPWNDLPGDWWTFFAKSKALLATKVFMPVVGNHDTPTNSSHENTRSFTRYFALPYQDIASAFYQYQVGPASFLGLNSERPGEFAQVGKQRQMIRDWLYELPNLNSTWSFATWHIAPLNVGRRHWGQQFAYREAATALHGHVDWVFNGHEHLYQRFHPLTLSNNKLEERDSYDPQLNSVGYLIVPAAGAFPNADIETRHPKIQGLFDYLAFPEVDTDIQYLEAVGGKNPQLESFIGYVRVDLNGKNFHLTTKGAPLKNGRLGDFRIIDRVSYSKN